MINLRSSGSHRHPAYPLPIAQKCIRHGSRRWQGRHLSLNHHSETPPRWMTTRKQNLQQETMRRVVFNGNQGWVEEAGQRQICVCCKTLMQSPHPKAYEVVEGSSTTHQPLSREVKTIHRERTIISLFHETSLPLSVVSPWGNLTYRRRRGVWSQ